MDYLNGLVYLRSVRFRVPGLNHQSAKSNLEYTLGKAKKSNINERDLGVWERLRYRKFVKPSRKNLGR